MPAKTGFKLWQQLECLGTRSGCIEYSDGRGERSVCPSKAITAPAEWRSELKGFIIQTSQVAEAADNAFGPGTLNAGRSVSRARRVPENWNKERRATYVHPERWRG